MHKRVTLRLSVDKLSFCNTVTSWKPFHSYFSREPLMTPVSIKILHGQTPIFSYDGLAP